MVAKMTSHSDVSILVASCALLLLVYFWMSSGVTLLVLCEISLALFFVSSFNFLFKEFVHSLMKVLKSSTLLTLTLE